MDGYISKSPIRPGEKQTAAQAVYEPGRTGTISYHQDLDYTDQSTKVELSSVPVKAILCVNTGVTALVPGTVAQWASGGVGKNVDTNAVAAEVGAGIVDPYLSGSVATGERFLLFVEGPVQVMTDAVIAANAFVKTGALGQASVHTNAAVVDLATGFGQMLEASTGVGDLARCHVNFK